MKNDHLFQRHGTHLPYLMLALRCTHGPILELGAGMYSTLTLHYAKDALRELYTLDSDQEWLDCFAELASPTHKLIHMPTWDDDIITSQHWGLALVDHHPDLRRQTEVIRLQDCAQIVVVHDTENHIHGYDFSGYKFVKEFRDISHCYTTLASNFYDVELICN